MSGRLQSILRRGEVLAVTAAPGGQRLLTAKCHRHLRAVVAHGVVVGRHRGGGREGPPEGVPERLDAGGAQLVELGAARLFHERAGLVAHAALPPVLFR